ncbi:gonadotropin-releasing hormone receptor-like [Leucoraja erinacea]|uniref:gonadotropin-releasing hormone receptor-like n=1 Tax=Leucoraja erinaceus TaxID=7782 RepID=UPI002453C3D5|nr:gonadotropin-releasing hormone receptor-like [Leucoraja erinacea]
MAVKSLLNGTLVEKSFFSPNERQFASAPNCSMNLPTLTSSGVIRVSVTFILLIFSVSSNVTFLVIQRRKRASRLKLLLHNLMAANLVETLVVMPMDGAWNITVQWVGGQFLCKALNFLKLFSMYCPALMMVLISLDRYLVITKPLASRAAGLHTGKYIIATTWLLSLLLALPQLWLFKMLHYTEPCTFSQCATLDSFQGQWDQTVYNFFTFAFLFIVPLFIMLICNFKIIIEMTKWLRPNANQIDLKQTRNGIPKARMKIMKMTIAFIISFMICWTPYYLLGIWHWFDPELHNKLPEPVNHFLFVFGLLNPCIDPLIYAYFS